MNRKNDILVFVESPGKIKTIQGFLGDQYTVEASIGHIRQIASKNGSVTFDKGFVFQWEDSPEKIKRITKAIKETQPKEIILATDADREGEAIAWHIRSLIDEMKYNKASITRIHFYEITENAIKEALKNKREIDYDLVNAYLTRAGFDYRLGYALSQELWKKIICYKNNQSAGRVQSWALKVIVLRENERTTFNKQKYYSLTLSLKVGDGEIESVLHSISGKKIDKILDKKILEDLKLPKELQVKDITSKTVKINPPAPFITSTFQQAASTRLKIDIAQAMRIAQDLYEGVEVNGKRLGLITYMRTDSTNISEDAVEKIRKFIKDNFPEHLPKKANLYKGKVKNAQEAHECIRPTYVNIKPEDVKKQLTDIHYKVYEMIWRRTVACQMNSAENEQVSVKFEHEKLEFRSSFSRLSYNGYLEVYNEEIEETGNIPAIKVDQVLKVTKSKIGEHETQPPARFSEATLVKEMEKYGVGRPSTYPTIIDSIKKREYVVMKNKFFEPTLKGKIVYYFLENFFSNYVDLYFTSKIEEFLNDIAEGKREYENTLKSFLDEIEKSVEQVEKISLTEVVEAISTEFMKIQKTPCPNCGTEMKLRMRNSVYLSCPSCNSIKQIDGEQKNLGDSQFIKTDKYSMIKKKDGTNVYLPVGFKEEMNEEKVEFTLTLPKEIGNIGKMPFIAGMSKYGFYIKYKDKFIGISSLDALMKIKQSHLEVIKSLIEEGSAEVEKNNQKVKVKAEKIGFSFQEKEGKRTPLRYIDLIFEDIISTKE